MPRPVVPGDGYEANRGDNVIPDTRKFTAEEYAANRDRRLQSEARVHIVGEDMPVMTTRLTGHVNDSLLTTKNAGSEALIARMEAGVEPGVKKYIKMHGQAPAGHVDREGQRPAPSGQRRG